MTSCVCHLLTSLGIFADSVKQLVDINGKISEIRDQHRCFLRVAENVSIPMVASSVGWIHGPSMLPCRFKGAIGATPSPDRQPRKMVVFIVPAPAIIIRR
jgi:hypothetical protein